MIFGIVGLGHVGPPPVMEFANAGVDVIGFDVDAAEVAGLTAGRALIGDAPDARRQGALPGSVDFRAATRHLRRATAPVA